MSSKILVICPSRERSQKIDLTIEAWRKYTEGHSDFLIVCDDDDPELEQYISKAGNGVYVTWDKPIKMCPSVNRAFKSHPNYEYYMFIGDDHLFRTVFEVKMMEAAGNKGIVYGNDLLQGKNLATHCLMTSNIPKSIGYIAIPGLIHLFMDNFWMELGSACNILHYLDDVIVEHMHPEAKKATRDNRYQIVNSQENFNHDRDVFLTWLSDQKQKDVEIINGI